MAKRIEKTNIKRRTKVKILNNFFKTIRSKYRRAKIIHYRENGIPLKIIVGAAATHQDGWLSTDQSFLDLADEKTWKALFKQTPVDALFAEHVWEHLDRHDAIISTNNAYRHLVSGGVVRVAVPDGLHPSKEYIEQVKPNGTGPGADDHKVLYTYKTLSQIFENAGFRVRLLEYFDEDGQFHKLNWDNAGGKVLRSLQYDSRNEGGEINYSSIIIDAQK